MANTVAYPRRVSFDLSHNVIYTLPTIEECKNAIKQKHREEWERRSLNEDMLNDDIISEIEQDILSHYHADEQSEQVVPIKSCLKKPLPIAAPLTVATVSHKKKTNHNKKRKRNSSSARNKVQLISVN